MQLNDLAVAIEQRREQSDLAQQLLGIARAAGRIVRDQAIATAIEARTEAKGDVDVNRQRALCGLRVAARRVLAQLLRPECLPEVRRGRIGRVARTRAVIALQQLGVECGALEVTA